MMRQPDDLRVREGRLLPPLRFDRALLRAA
jgi:hypothetical protein